MITLLLVSISFLLLVLLLLGYPITIYVLSKAFPKKIHKGDITPTVTVIVPCYNENHVIEEKIENTWSMDYPRNSLEIVIVDSASTDNTNKTVREITNRYNVKLLEQTKREGKASAINVALRKATGEIIVLTDADAFLERDAIKKIVRNFADSTVGAVVARYEMHGSSLLSKTVGFLFSIFREKIRHYESLIDSASYFTGEFLAFRKALIESINEDAVADDMFVLFEIREKGYRCVTESTVKVYEYIPKDAMETFHHRRRTTYGILYVTAKFKNLLFRTKYGLFGCYILPMSTARIVLLPITFFLFEISLIYLLVSISTSGFILAIVFLVCLLIPLYLLKKDAIYMAFSILILQMGMAVGILDFLAGNPAHRLWPKLKKSHGGNARNVD